MLAIKKVHLGTVTRRPMPNTTASIRELSDLNLNRRARRELEAFTPFIPPLTTGASSPFGLDLDPIEDNQPTDLDSNPPDRTGPLPASQVEPSEPRVSLAVPILLGVAVVGLAFAMR